MIFSVPSIAVRMLRKNMLLFITSVFSIFIPTFILISFLLSLHYASPIVESAHQSAMAANSVSSLRPVVIVLASVALIASAMLMLSNFEIFLYKYKYEMSVLRSLGASRYQMFKILWLQTAIIIGCGGGLAYLGAMISHQLVQNWLSDVLSFGKEVTSFDYGLAFIVVLITMILIQLMIIIPTIRRSKCLPLQIIRNNEEHAIKPSPWNKRWGFIFFLCGLLFLIFGYAHSIDGEEALYYLIAAIFMVLGVFKLMPIYMSSLLDRIAGLLRYSLGNLSYVAVKLLAPQVRRNTYSILGISLFVVISIFGGTLFQTIKMNEERYFSSRFPTDTIIESRTSNSSIDPKQLTQEVMRITGVHEVSTLGTTFGEYVLPAGAPEEQAQSVSFAMTDMKQMADMGILPSAESEPLGGGILITERLAERLHLKVGDAVTVSRRHSDSTIIGGGPDARTEATLVTVGKAVISGVMNEHSYPLASIHIDAYVDWDQGKSWGEKAQFSKLFMNTKGDKEIIQKLQQIIISNYPGEADVSYIEDERHLVERMTQQRKLIFNLFMITIITCVSLGISNSLVSNIYSRRKEYAILRTMKVTPRNLVYVVMLQIFIYLLVGSIIGGVAGVIFSWILGWIDQGVSLNFRTSQWGIATLTVVLGVVFVPLSIALGKRTITQELGQNQ